MARINLDQFNLQQNERTESSSNTQSGGSFLERLLQETAENEGFEMPQELSMEVMGEIPIPSRKKRFKFLRFPKLKAMLDMLDDAAPEKTDGYVIMSEEAEEEDMLAFEEPVVQVATKRDDTDEFLNNIGEKLKSFGSLAKRRSEEQAKGNKLNQNDDDFDATVIRSIVEDESIVSETLADLLAFQGQKMKAIKMYQALSLKFPKKSSFFAKKITELK